MQRYSIQIICLIIWVLVLTPFFVGAVDLVKCGGPTESPCGFVDLVELVKSILDYILIIVAPLSAIMFAYAGFLYISSQGSVDKRKKANQIFTNVGIGLFFVVGAWLIVKAVLAGLVTGSDYNYLDM